MGEWTGEYDNYDEDYENQYDEEPEYISNCQCIASTDKAMLILHKNRQAWFPKSVVTSFEEELLEYKSWFNPDWKSTNTRMKEIDGDFI